MKKKVLYIHQYFITPKESGGTRSYWFAQELIKKGYKVTMLTGSFKSQKKLVLQQNINGINVISLKNKYSNEMGIFARLFSFIKFMFLSTFFALKEKNVGLVFATSTPLSIGFPALILKWFKRKKYIFEVRDLWPEVPIQMGGVKNKLLIWLLRRFEKTIYNNATHIIALSPGMKNGVLQTGVEESQVSIIPNMSKIDQFYLRKKDKDLMRKYNLLDDEFYVIHFGAMGLANGLDYIIDAAKLLQKHKGCNIKFLFAGAGGQEQLLKGRINKEKINNVTFLGKFIMDDMTKIVNIADCSITTFRNLPILQTNSPNKLFDSLSAQKPIIVNSAGWTKDMVEKNNCGAFVDPENPKELANLLIKWSNDSKLLKKMGANSRKLAETEYDKSILSNKFVKVIKRFI